MQTDTIQYNICIHSIRLASYYNV